MVAVQHERFRPDPGLEVAEMEALQREIADAAAFVDDLDFDPTALGSDSGEGRGAVAEPIVAGIDQAFRASDGSDVGPGQYDEAVSAVVVVRGEEVLERVSASRSLELPYVPGLLAFREGGSILAALERLETDPDVLLFDGSGRIHYREAGLATHVGVAVGRPAVGVAKSLLCGAVRGDVQNREAGTILPIEADDEMTAEPGTVVGAAVQTRQFASDRQSINPLYVSPGHRVGWETAAALVLATAREYKLPEPIRLADRWVGELTAAE